MPADKVTIERWIHAIDVMLELEDWTYESFDSRHHGPTHIAVKDRRMLVLFARPSGGKLLAQHVNPHRVWTEFARQNWNEGGERGVDIEVMIATPNGAAALRAAVEGTV